MAAQMGRWQISMVTADAIELEHAELDLKESIAKFASSKGTMFQELSVIMRGEALSMLMCYPKEARKKEPKQVAAKKSSR